MKIEARLEPSRTLPQPSLLMDGVEMTPILPFLATYLPIYSSHLRVFLWRRMIMFFHL